jgi:hypothetical protein
MRGAPHSGFATLISRARKPARCHLMVVSGLRIFTASNFKLGMDVGQTTVAKDIGRAAGVVVIESNGLLHARLKASPEWR